MGTVFVIGNGFDLSLGLRTSYKDFFKSKYFKTDDEKVHQLHLQLSFSSFNEYTKASVFDYLKAYSNLTNWCDIEGALGESLNYYNSGQGLILDEQSFFDLHTAYCKYLNEVLKHDFDFLNYESPSYKLAKTLVDTHNLSVLNFNYTPTLERIDPFYIDHVDYVHGSLKDSSIIFGVEDDLPVSKESSFLLKTFSPHYRHHNVRLQLLNADHIIIFGHSLSKADYHYFKELFMRQTDPKNVFPQQRISIFTKNEETKRDILWQIRFMNGNKSHYLFDLCHFEIFRTENDQDRIDAFLEELTPEYPF